MSIKIGTCGYGYYKPKERWKEKYKSKLQAYSDNFEVVELNRTFYKLPMVKTAEKWRSNVFQDFEFTIKTWQAITHPTSSPTWRNKKGKLSKKQEENFGYLKPNQEVMDAWHKTKEIAEALETDICLIQTPGSFECNQNNENNIRELLTKIDRENIELAWEPRGNWKDNPDKIKEICEDLDLIHVVDIMRRNPLSSNEIAYIRLHGLNKNEYDYNYDYSQKELKTLAKKLLNLEDEYERIYCMFNNYEMFDNATSLIEIL